MSEGKLCRNLRWKGHRPDLDRQRVLEVVHLNHVPYSCLRTAQPWGVDDDPAAPERCLAGRACFDSGPEIGSQETE